MFKEKVGRCSMRELTRMATERKNGSLGYAEAMLSIYNKRQRYPLRWSKLYKTKDTDSAEQCQHDDELIEHTEELCP